MGIIIGALLLVCWFVFLRACYHAGQDRRDERLSRAWHAERDVYRRERNR